MTRKTRWILGGSAAAVVAFLLLRKMSDLEALTRMIIAETDFGHDKTEMAQIVFVALNRANKWHVPVVDVVSPSGSGAPVAWNRGPRYRQRFDDASDSRYWDRAEEFVKDVLAGKYSNMKYTAFVHPQGSDEPPCSGGRVVANTIAGQRCLPSWAVNGKVIGVGMFA